MTWHRKIKEGIKEEEKKNYTHAVQKPFVLSRKSAQIVA